MAAKRWPALPKRAEGLAGPITVTVRRVESFKAGDGDLCWGLYQPESRRIVVAGKVPPALRWHTFWHEWAHAWLIDSGLTNLIHGKDAELSRNVEIACDSLATAMVRQMVAVQGLNGFEGASPS
jgi:Zn-dependent peptidase ImmA (M78 family)